MKILSIWIPVLVGLYTGVALEVAAGHETRFGLAYRVFEELHPVNNASSTVWSNNTAAPPSTVLPSSQPIAWAAMILSLMCGRLLVALITTVLWVVLKWLLVGRLQPDVDAHRHRVFSGVRTVLR